MKAGMGVKMISDKPVASGVDKDKLEFKVKNMYRNVAQNPGGDYHFELGKRLALKLGYKPKELNAVPKEAVDSFSGVGYTFDFARIESGHKIVCFGSGAGMDLFIAAQKTGIYGHVFGVDMTPEQLDKSKALAFNYDYHNVSFQEAYIESLLLETNSFDLLISNGVINLSAEKEKVFRQAARILKRSGQIVISDIVTEKRIPEDISNNSTLWAGCIAGAMRFVDYKRLILQAGFEIHNVKHNNQYQFISNSAIEATELYGVKSITLYAIKT